MQALREEDHPEDANLGLGAEEPFQHVTFDITAVILNVTVYGEKRSRDVALLFRFSSSA